jgi:hypothetical protein
MLLAAYEARRPTADLDALARWIANDQGAIVSLVSDIARLPLNDGVEYQTETATSRIIRDQAIYSGVRIAMDCAIATAIALGPANTRVRWDTPARHGRAAVSGTAQNAEGALAQPFTVR